MGGRATRKAIALLLIGVLLVGTACTRPKPKEAEIETPLPAEEAAPTMQPSPGQTVVSVRETLTPTPTSEVPVVVLPTVTPTPLPPGVPSPTPLPTAVSSPTPLPTAVSIPTAEQAPPPPETPAVHIVQSGETLFSIGRRYGVPWQDIARANGITYPYQILVGQRLSIPRGEVPAPPVSGRIHIVQRGENLFRIGLKYGVPWRDIAQANGISDPTQIVVGQRLVIP